MPTPSSCRSWRSSGRHVAKACAPHDADEAERGPLQEDGIVRRMLDINVKRVVTDAAPLIIGVALLLGFAGWLIHPGEIKGLHFGLVAMLLAVLFGFNRFRNRHLIRVTKADYRELERLLAPHPHHAQLRSDEHVFRVLKQGVIVGVTRVSLAEVDLPAIDREFGVMLGDRFLLQVGWTVLHKPIGFRFTWAEDGSVVWEDDSDLTAPDRRERRRRRTILRTGAPYATAEEIRRFLRTASHCSARQVTPGQNMRQLISGQSALTDRPDGPARPTALDRRCLS